MKKVLAIVVLIAVIFLSALIYTPVVNDNTAKETANELLDIPLPDHTEFVETVYKAGKLVGNGNGMQYFGAILIKSELPLEELKEYYLSFSENEWECIVEKQTGTDIKVIEHGRLTFKTDIEGDNYYIVYSWGENDAVFGEWDIRGH